MMEGVHGVVEGCFHFVFCAGCEDPTAPEIYECVINFLKLPAEIEVSRVRPDRCTAGVAHACHCCYRHCSCCFPAAGTWSQNKAYSREWLVRGRIRVQLKKEDGTPVDPAIPNRERSTWVLVRGAHCHQGRDGRCVTMVHAVSIVPGPPGAAVVRHALAVAWVIRRHTCVF